MLTTDPFAPFLATIAERHYAAMAAPCPTCCDARFVRFHVFHDGIADISQKPCPDCDKPRPADHGPAMVFADWLEEQGDPQGEFIRHGVELEQPVRNRRGADNRVILTDRRSDLLARHGAEWARRVLGGVWPEAFFEINSIDRHLLVAIGDPKGPHLEIARAEWGVALPESFKFPTLAGFLGIGPVLARRVPLRRVEFADKAPQRDGERYWWFSNVAFERPRPFVPPEVFALMGDDCIDSWHGDDDAAGYAYLTEAAANDALSDAAIRWAVQQREVAPKAGGG